MFRVKRYGMATASSIQNRTSPHSDGLRGPSPDGYPLRPGGPQVAAIKRLQVQLQLPYGREPRNDERIRRQLDLGWRIAQLQRLSDQEVLVTFETSSS